MSYSSNHSFAVFQIALILPLLAVLFILHQPVPIQSAQLTPTPVAVPEGKTWLNYRYPEEIIDLAIRGDDIWAATDYSVIHWERAGGRYTQYTVIDGLPGGRIMALSLDATGRPWVITEHTGLSYLDGQRWTAFSPPEATDLAFEENISASASGMWISTGQAVSYFSGQPLPEFQSTYTTTAGLPRQWFSLLSLDPAGQPWVAGQGVVSRFEGQRWTTYTVEDGLPAQPITTLVFDPAGRPWIGTAGGGVGYLNPAESKNRGWITYTTEAGLAGNWISVIAFDPTGQPWVGTADSGVSHLDQTVEERPWTTYTVADGLAGHVVDTIFFDAEGQPWVVTRNEGISAFDGQKWTSYPYPGDSLKGWVTATAMDDTGQLWIGQANGQVSQLAWEGQTGLDSPRWTTYHTSGPADNYIQAAAVDRAGRKWFGTKNGAVVFDGQTWQNYTIEDGLIDNNVTAITVDDAGQIWFGTLKGVSRLVLPTPATEGSENEGLDGPSWTSYPFEAADNLFNDWVRAMAVDKAGHLWVGRSTGLSWLVPRSPATVGSEDEGFDGQSWTTYTVEDGLAGTSVYAIVLDAAGDLWIGASGGVSRFSLSEGDNATWTTYTVEDGLADDYVPEIVIDGDNIKWFGTLNGVSRFDGQTWITYTVEDGLASDWAEAMAVDREGHLWVGTEMGGLSEFDGQSWRIHSTKLPVKTIVLDPAGSLWFGASKGISALVDTRLAADLSFTWEPVSITPPVMETKPAAPPVTAPPPDDLSPAGPPKQSLLAWSVAPDGAVFVLDAANSLYQLDPTDLTPLAQSPPLFETGPKNIVYLQADTGQVFVGSNAITQTLVLDRANFTEMARLNQAGQMALDPGRQLIMLPLETTAPAYFWEFWVYDLADLAQPPRQIQTRCLSGSPAIDPHHRYLYIQTFNCDSSPPHQRGIYTIYDLDTLSLLKEMESRDPGDFSQPAIAGQADLMATIYHEASGLNQPVIFDLQGQELKEGPSEHNYGSPPIIDRQGEWLYLSRARDLAVRRVPDLSLQSLLPFTTTRPAGLALSPDDEILYLFGNGWLTAFPTIDLQQLGIQPVRPWPIAWTEEKDFSGNPEPFYVYPSPTFEQDGVALIELLHPHDLYRTTDQAQSWLPLPKPGNRISFGYARPALSLSPDFSHDQTLVTPGFYSMDAGETWLDWSPPFAFVSDRAGNREIYTMNQAGQDIRRLTDHPAADENPAWSPGWTWLAFQSERKGNWDIFMLQAGCQPECELQQLTDDPADDMLPAWSPDGRWIAFVSTRDGNPEIYIMDREGQHQRRLTFNEAGDWRPAWLRDSQHLIFASGRNGSSDIFQLIVPPADAPPLTSEAELKPLITESSDDRDPAVGPDGAIFYLSDRDGTVKSYTYVVSSYNSSVTIKAYANQAWAEGHPSPVSPEGALVSVEENGETHLYQVHPYREPVLLTGSAGGFNGQPAAGPVWWLPDPETSRAWLAAHP